MCNHRRFEAGIALVFSCLLIALNQAARAKAPTPPNRQSNKFRQNAVCANQDPGTFVEYEENCHNFYVCMVGGQAVMGTCPSTMLFNPVTRLCDSPANVRCRTTTEAPTTAPITATTTRPPPLDLAANDLAVATQQCQALAPQQEMERITFIGSSFSCQRYYICYYGQAVMQECSTNLHWNANIAKCDMPANAKCHLTATPPNNGNGNGNNGNGNNGNGSGTGGNTNIDNFINCPNYGQHIFPHMGRCDIFIYCVKGHPTLQQCPFYYHFDIVTKSCKWRTQALCVRDLNINLNSK